MTSAPGGPKDGVARCRFWAGPPSRIGLAGVPGHAARSVERRFGRRRCGYRGPRAPTRRRLRARRVPRSLERGLEERCLPAAMAAASRALAPSRWEPSEDSSSADRSASARAAIRQSAATSVMIASQARGMSRRSIMRCGREERPSGPSIGETLSLLELPGPTAVKRPAGRRERRAPAGKRTLRSRAPGSCAQSPRPSPKPGGAHGRIAHVVGAIGAHYRRPR